MTCKKAQGFLEKHAIKVTKISDAGKHKHGQADALRLAKGAARIVVVKGKKLTVIDVKKDAPDDDTLLHHLLGPTGNLRAPTVRVDKSLLVGFSEDAYRLFMDQASSRDR